ncbi:MAG: TP901-1 family phage major tail protein [Pseudophaeobacter arcticus]|jgi:TP901-1 family phage major tail protein
MATQNGKDLLIKVDMTGDGQFETLAGLRATRISFNAETVDVTSLESQGGWRELLAGAGVRSASISGSGGCFAMKPPMSGRASCSLTG